MTSFFDKHTHINIIISLIVMTALILFSQDISAREKKTASATGAIDAKTFDVLTKAQELTEKGSYNEAIKTLDSIKGSPKLSKNSYAKSQMWNFYAFIYASQEKYKKAIDAYEQILAEPDAPAGLKLQSNYTIAQLYFQIEDYKSVISFMNEWLKNVKKQTTTAHIMLAQAHYQIKSYPDALKHLDKAIQQSKEDGETKIDEDWLRMKSAIYYDQKNLKATLATYEELFHYYPKLSYLKQIAGLYGELGDNRKRLTTYDSIYLDGKLTKESEVLNLAYMYLGQDIPYKAGRIIETGMKAGVIESSAKNIETLANAWAQANEHKKAIPALERSAKLSNKGLLYARLAGVYFDAGDFDKAANAAQKADEKGSLTQRGGNLMLMGMALFNTKKFENALQAFRHAKTFKSNFKDARKWEKYTLSELERIRLLEQKKIKLAKETEEAIAAEQEGVDSFGKNIIND